mgnify:CR=1 FL=1
MRSVCRLCGHHSVRAGKKSAVACQPGVGRSGGLPLSEIKIQNSSEFSRKRGAKFALSTESRRKHRGCGCTPAHATAAGNAGRARAYGISGANPSRGCRRIFSIFRCCTDCRRTARASAAPTATNKTKSTNTAAIFWWIWSVAILRKV